MTLAEQLPHGHKAKAACFRMTMGCQTSRHRNRCIKKTLQLLSHSGDISKPSISLQLSHPFAMGVPSPYLLGPGPPYQCAPFINRHQMLSVPHSSFLSLDFLTCFISSTSREGRAWVDESSLSRAQGPWLCTFQVGAGSSPARSEQAEL